MQKIVIEIPGYVYQNIRNMSGKGTLFEEAIKNGTPLPEHHGRLVDADLIEQEMIIAEGKAEGSCHYYISDVIDRAKEYIIDAETIIPATKEGDGE